MKSILLAAISLSLTAGLPAATTILDPLSTAGDFDGTGTDDLAPGGTFSGGWVNTGGRNVGYGSSSATRLADASDQYIRIDRRRNITLDLGYITSGSAEVYNLSYYTIAAAATVDLGVDTAQLSLYYTDNDTRGGSILDQMDFTFAPTSTTAWDFASFTSDSFAVDPGAGKSLFLIYTVNSPTNDANIGIDNISLSVVPEPSAALLGGLGCLLLLRRRR